MDAHPEANARLTISPVLSPGRRSCPCAIVLWKSRGSGRMYNGSCIRPWRSNRILNREEHEKEVFSLWDRYVPQSPVRKPDCRAHHPGFPGRRICPGMKEEFYSDDCRDDIEPGCPTVSRITALLLAACQYPPDDVPQCPRYLMPFPFGDMPLSAANDLTPRWTSFPSGIFSYAALHNSVHAEPVCC